jgi:aromatic-L-amino-acid decarboxylase
MVMATTGTTSSLAFDPLTGVGEAAKAAGAWLHVDGAMAGAAAVCPEFRWVNDGLELADSYVFDLHKWLFVNFDASAFWVADRAAVIEALSVLPEYLRNAATETGAVIDYRDWQVPLGRRFRALKIWFTLRHYGAEGLRFHLREHVALAGELAAKVAADERFELAAPARLNLVCLRHRDGDETTRKVIDRLNSGGEVFVTHTRLDGRLVLRVSVGAVATRREHVERLWNLLDDAAG